ncbi:hypothetical protein HK096_006025 [Nowakowskiella sp. JEL0078]|nr:hypothetical protein HK096_006025 [Nowakowskiella sp. JEL0078]
MSFQDPKTSLTPSDSTAFSSLNQYPRDSNAYIPVSPGPFEFKSLTSHTTPTKLTTDSHLLSSYTPQSILRNPSLLMKLSTQSPQINSEHGNSNIRAVTDNAASFFSSPAEDKYIKNNEGISYGLGDSHFYTTLACHPLASLTPVGDVSTMTTVVLQEKKEFPLFFLESKNALQQNLSVKTLLLSEKSDDIQKVQNDMIALLGKVDVSFLRFKNQYLKSPEPRGTLTSEESSVANPIIQLLFKNSLGLKEANLNHGPQISQKFKFLETLSQKNFIEKQKINQHPVIENVEVLKEKKSIFVVDDVSVVVKDEQSIVTVNEKPKMIADDKPTLIAKDDIMTITEAATTVIDEKEPIITPRMVRVKLLPPKLTEKFQTLSALRKIKYPRKISEPMLSKPVLEKDQELWKNHVLKFKTFLSELIEADNALDEENANGESGENHDQVLRFFLDPVKRILSPEICRTLRHHIVRIMSDGKFSELISVLENEEENESGDEHGSAAQKIFKKILKFCEIRIQDTEFMESGLNLKNRKSSLKRGYAEMNSRKPKKAKKLKRRIHEDEDEDYQSDDSESEEEQELSQSSEHIFEILNIAFGRAFSSLDACEISFSLINGLSHFSSEIIQKKGEDEKFDHWTKKKLFGEDLFKFTFSTLKNLLNIVFGALEIYAKEDG